MSRRLTFSRALPITSQGVLLIFRSLLTMQVQKSYQPLTWWMDSVGAGQHRLARRTRAQLSARNISNRSTSGLRKRKSTSASSVSSTRERFTTLTTAIRTCLLVSKTQKPSLRGSWTRTSKCRRRCATGSARSGAHSCVSAPKWSTSSTLSRTVSSNKSARLSMKGVNYLLSSMRTDGRATASGTWRINLSGSTTCWRQLRRLNLTREPILWRSRRRRWTRFRKTCTRRIRRWSDRT